MSTDTWEPAPTEEQVVDFCLRMKPDEAAVKSDSSLCVTLLIDRMVVDGKVLMLELQDGKWFSFVVRVSGDRQRSGRAKAEVADEDKHPAQKQDGFSEEEQIKRGIRYCVLHRLAFKVYSDAGVTGEFPNNDPALIQKLLKKKAARYRRIFTKVLLDETSLSRRSAQEITSLRNYMEARCSTILRAGVTEEEAYQPASSESQIRSFRRRRGRTRKRVYYRQAFSQLWSDVEANATHSAAACDASRICRDPDLHVAFLQLLSDHNVSILGIVEAVVALDVEDDMSKGMLYLIASYHASRLVETATTTFRGSVQRLESGRHIGRLPWWITKDRKGYPQLVPDRVRIAQKIVDLYLAGHGVGRIGTQLIADGDLVDGKILTDRKIVEVLNGDTVAGKSSFYGLEWDVLPAAITDGDLLAELRARREVRKGAIPHISPNSWTEHLFTGLLRCSCGQRMYFQQTSPNSEETHPDGWYRCLERHGKAKGSHATVDTRMLADFFGELVASNPHLLSGALADNLSPGSTQERTAWRALLEATLQEAEARFTNAQTVARVRAEGTACGLGMTAGSEAFEQVVGGLVKNDLLSASMEVDQLRSEIARLRVEASKRKRDDKFLDSLAEMQDWNGLDEFTRNRLLRSVFEEITVYPRKAENRIEIRLHGLADALAPVYPVHTNRNAYRLPTVGEWLDDTYAPDKRHRGAPPSVRAMRTLSEAQREVSHVDGAEELFDFMRAHKIRFNVQAAIKSYQKQLAAKGADDRLMTVLETVYTKYVEIERVRLGAEKSSPAQ